MASCLPAIAPLRRSTAPSPSPPLLDHYHYDHSSSPLHHDRENPPLHHDRENLPLHHDRENLPLHHDRESLPLYPSSPSPPSTSITTTTTASTTWAFLASPALRLLPKWPLSYLSTPAPPSIPASLRRPPPSSTHSLHSLLTNPPIAACVASYLYGHDLLTMRTLSSQFRSLLAAAPSPNSQRSYYSVLLLKSLLCPREGTSSEPCNVACTSRGGNVGPCRFCNTVVCETCVSPEIWTTRRYRYICPTCSTAPVDDFCSCQGNLWICRPCYRARWVADLSYDATWCSKGASCARCGGLNTHADDPRIPRERRGSFLVWMKESVVIRRKRKLRTGKERERERNKSQAQVLAEVDGRRSVWCGWCSSKIGVKEKWGERPGCIERGERKGEMWGREMERRRREAEEAGEEVEELDTMEGRRM